MSPSKAIPYWIQRADFSTTDHDPVGVADAVRAFETQDWRRELNLYSQLERAGAECCPPGIGFVDPGGDILHICPDANGRATVHYQYDERRRLFGLVPMPRTVLETRLEVQPSGVLDLIRFFFEGRRDRMLERLGPA